MLTFSMQAVSEASKHRDRLLPLKTFIYTSGIMVYGNDPRIRDEAWPIGKSTYAEFRRTVEEAVTLSPDVFGIVIRPGMKIREKRTVGGTIAVM